MVVRCSAGGLCCSQQGAPNRSISRSRTRRGGGARPAPPRGAAFGGFECPRATDLSLRNSRGLRVGHGGAGRPGGSGSHPARSEPPEERTWGMSNPPSLPEPIGRTSARALGQIRGLLSTLYDDVALNDVALRRRGLSRGGAVTLQLYNPKTKHSRPTRRRAHVSSSSRLRFFVLYWKTSLLPSRTLWSFLCRYRYSSKPSNTRSTFVLISATTS